MHCRYLDSPIAESLQRVQPFDVYWSKFFKYDCIKLLLKRYFDQKVIQQTKNFATLDGWRNRDAFVPRRAGKAAEQDVHASKPRQDRKILFQDPCRVRVTKIRKVDTHSRQPRASDGAPIFLVDQDVPKAATWRHGGFNGRDKT